MAAQSSGTSNILVFECHHFAELMQSLHLSIEPTGTILTIAWPHLALFQIYKTSGIFRVTFTCGVYVVFFDA